MAFVDQGEFEAMKTLSGWEAARCDEHPFRAKIKVVMSEFPKVRKYSSTQAISPQCLNVFTSNLI